MGETSGHDKLPHAAGRYSSNSVSDRTARCLNRFRRDESGATVIEYALISGFIAIVLISALSLIGSELHTTFVRVDAGFPKTP